MKIDDNSAESRIDLEEQEREERLAHLINFDIEKSLSHESDCESQISDEAIQK